MGGVKDQTMSRLKTKYYSQLKSFKTVHGGGKKPSKLKIQKQSEDKIIKNIRNYFKLNRENRNLFKLKSENKAVKDRLTLFQQQKEDYYKPVRVGNFLTIISRYQNESSSDRNKNLSVKEYLKEVKTYLRDIIINLPKSDT